MEGCFRVYLKITIFSLRKIIKKWKGSPTVSKKAWKRQNYATVRPGRIKRFKKFDNQAKLPTEPPPRWHYIRVSRALFFPGSITVSSLSALFSLPLVSGRCPSKQTHFPKEEIRLSMKDINPSLFNERKRRTLVSDR